MPKRLSPTTYFCLFGGCWGLALLNLGWQSGGLGIVIGIAYLATLGTVLGSVALARSRIDSDWWAWKMILGFFLTLVILCLAGGSALALARLTPVVAFCIFAIVPALVAPAYFRIHQADRLSLVQTLNQLWTRLRHRKESQPVLATILGILYTTLALSCFGLLFGGQTLRAIQTPWQTVSAQLFFGCYWIATLILVLYGFSTRRTRFAFLALALHGVLSTCVALIVYRLGFGFDPFIHQATERIIATTGTITPKPPYYLGQYGVVVLLHWLTQLPISILDRILVPLSAGILFAPLTALVLRRTAFQGVSFVAALAVFLLPTSSWIMTTPQNLGNIFVLIASLLAIQVVRKELPIALLYGVAISAVVIHPIAGVPLLVSVVLIHLALCWSPEKISTKIQLTVVTLLAMLPLPLLLIMSGATFTLSRPHRSDFFFSIQNDLALDLSYLYQTLGAVILIAAALLGWRQLRKTAPHAFALLLGPLAISGMFVLVRYGLSFPALQNNDQEQFTLRLAILLGLTLLPLATLGVAAIIQAAATAGRFSRLVTAGTLASLLTASLYLSYPRLDTYQPTAFFSLSSSDVKAVRAIEQIAKPDHIVLANQMVGVAAIAEFGFTRYYDDQFYYSMPSGTPHTRYDRYLEMVYQGAKRETMELAMREANVTQAFLVINRYWKNAEKIAASASQTADQVFSIDDGELTIFRYERTPAAVADSDPTNADEPK